MRALSLIVPFTLCVLFAAQMGGAQPVQSGFAGDRSGRDPRRRIGTEAKPATIVKHVKTPCDGRICNHASFFE